MTSAAASVCLVLNTLIDAQLGGEAPELDALEAALRECLAKVSAAQRSGLAAPYAAAGSESIEASADDPDDVRDPSATPPPAAATAHALSHAAQSTPSSAPSSAPTSTPTTDAATVHVSPCVTYDPQQYIEAFSQFGSIKQVTPKGAYCFVTFASAASAAAACTAGGITVAGRWVWVKARTPGIRHIPAGNIRDVCTAYVWPCPGDMDAFMEVLAQFGPAKAVTPRGKYCFVTFASASAAASACALGRLCVAGEWVQLKPKTRRGPKVAAQPRVHSGGGRRATPPNSAGGGAYTPPQHRQQDAYRSGGRGGSGRRRLRSGDGRGAERGGRRARGGDAGGALHAVSSAHSAADREFASEQRFSSPLQHEYAQRLLYNDQLLRADLVQQQLRAEQLELQLLRADQMQRQARARSLAVVTGAPPSAPVSASSSPMASTMHSNVFASPSPVNALLSPSSRRVVGVAVERSGFAAQAAAATAAAAAGAAAAASPQVAAAAAAPPAPAPERGGDARAGGGDAGGAPGL
jgi:hypothetical protein